MFILSSHSLYGWPIANVFRLAKQLSFDGLELVITPDEETSDTNYLNSLTQRYELPVRSVHSPLSAYLPGWPLSTVGRVEASLIVAEKVHAKTLVIHPPSRFVVPTLKRLLNGALFYRYISDLRGYYRWFNAELEGFTASSSVIVAVENMPAEWLFGKQVYTSDFCLPERLRELKHIALDVTHLGTCGLDLLKTYEVLKDRVAHLHISNYNGREHRLLEDGSLPIKEFLGELKRAGYKDDIVLEFTPEAVGADDQDRAGKNLEKNLSFCRKVFI